MHPSCPGCGCTGDPSADPLWKSIPCSHPGSAGWVIPAGLVSERQVPVRQGVLPVQNGVPQLPPAAARGGSQGPHLLTGAGVHAASHSPTGPESPGLGHCAEPARGLEAHGAHDRVSHVLPARGEAGWWGQCTAHRLIPGLHSKTNSRGQTGRRLSLESARHAHTRP